MKARVLTASLLMSGAVSLFAQEAAEGGGHAEGWMAPIWGVPVIAWQVVNLLLVVALFIYLLRKPAPKFFGDRSKDIQTQLDQANRDKEEALARLKEVEQRMATLQSEVTGIEEASLKAAEADKLQVQAEAEAMRDRIRKETMDEIERRMVEARREALDVLPPTRRRLWPERRWQEAWEMPTRSAFARSS